MIWSWAEVTAEQVEGPTVYGAELINYPPGYGLRELGPGRVGRSVCATPDRTETARPGSDRADQDVRSEEGRNQTDRETDARKGAVSRGIRLTASRPTKGGARARPCRDAA